MHGRPLPSERDLAAQLGVSRSVVREAIQSLAQAGTLVSHRGHRPVLNTAAIAPVRRTKGTHLAVWLWPNTAHYAASSILRGIQSAKLDPEVQVLVTSGVLGDWESVLAAEQDFLERAAADPETLGIILWYLGGDRNLDTLRSIQQRGIPLVCVDRLPPGDVEVDFVGTNNEDAAYKAVQHLIQSGHRRIACISNIDPASSVADRERGFFSALKDNGLHVEDDLIQRATYDSPESMEWLCDFILNQKEPITGVFCVNDQLALNFQEALTRKGIKVPERLSLVGFDGLLRWLPGGGTLTTMSQDFERIGRIACTLVVERASQKPSNRSRHYLLDAPLFLGASTNSPYTVTSEKFLTVRR